MTPKEKEIKKEAKELVSNFQSISGHKRFSIAYALIAVEYLIIEQDMWQNGQFNPVNHWQQVKAVLLKMK